MGRGLVNWSSVSIMFLESRKRIDLLKEEHNTKGTLEYIHSDLWESVMVPSKGCAYYPLLIDNFFKKSLGILVETDEWCILLPSRSGMHWLRNRLGSRYNVYALIIDWSFVRMNLIASTSQKRSWGTWQYVILHIKIVWQKGWIEL